MICPECDGKLKVVDGFGRDYITWRRRKCDDCGYTFYTQEVEMTEDEMEGLRSEWMTLQRERRRKRKCQ